MLARSALRKKQISPRMNTDDTDLQNSKSSYELLIRVNQCYLWRGLGFSLGSNPPSSLILAVRFIPISNHRTRRQMLQSKPCSESH